MVALKPLTRQWLTLSLEPLQALTPEPHPHRPTLEPVYKNKIFEADWYMRLYSLICLYSIPSC